MKKKKRFAKQLSGSVEIGRAGRELGGAAAGQSVVLTVAARWRPG